MKLTLVSSAPLKMLAKDNTGSAAHADSRSAELDQEAQVSPTNASFRVQVLRQGFANKLGSKNRLETSASGQQTMSESMANEAMLVTPVFRSDRTFASERSRDSSEVRPSQGHLKVTELGLAQPSRQACCKVVPHLKRGTTTYQAYLTYLTLGVIYGDIGTSPLYTVSALFTSPPTAAAVVGGISLMIWTLIIVTFIKYIVFILMADDYGEGGTFAIFALLSRGLRQRIKSDTIYRRVNSGFAVIAIISVAAILADGVLTPAISVMGAINGLSVVSTNVDSGVVAGVSIAILFLFFLSQRFGTSKVAFAFSPIIIMWYLFLAGIGIYNITLYPTILTAFNPYEAILFLRGDYPGFGGWNSLAAAFLTVTGSEAMFADLGHFNRKAIRVSFTFVVLPCLLLAYLGQGASLALNPGFYSNAMYLTLPNGMLYPMLVLAILASIVASQAMVSATFSIVSQAIRLQYLPRLTIIHTDRLEYGQVYVPEVNYFLMVLVIVIVSLLSSSINKWFELTFTFFAPRLVVIAM